MSNELRDARRTLVKFVVLLCYMEILSVEEFRDFLQENPVGNAAKRLLRCR